MSKEDMMLKVLEEIRDILRPKGKVVDLRFEKNSDNSVLDKSTGLVWGPTFEKEMTFSDAEKACKEFNLGGHKDWRLPTVKELIALVDYDKREPAINSDFFPDTKCSYYWTGTPLAGTPLAGSSDYAWIVNFNGGNVNGFSEDYTYFVRLVRSSQ